MARASSTAGLTERWARFASEIAYERLPSEAVLTAKCLLLDTIGTALAGSALGDGAAEVARLVRANPGNGEATLLGYGERISALMAGFGNGAFAHSLNYDALGARGGHIGVAAVPTPLVMMERRGAVSGKDLLAAVAVAAELTGRLAGALTAAGVDTGAKFLEGQLLSYFGATAGGGRVVGLGPAQMHSALGAALMQAAGTRQVSFEGRSGKAIYGGYCNHGAVMSVLLAELGLDTACAALEGPAGLYALFYDNRFDRATIADDLGRNFPGLDVRFKPYPTSGIVQPFIQAAAELRRAHRLQVDDIRSIHVVAGPRSKAWLEPAEERRHPRNAATAANSIFFGVAKALANGDVVLADMTLDGLQQPEALRLATLIDYTIDEQLTSDEAIVRVSAHDGVVLNEHADIRGESMSYGDLVTKFHDCAQYAPNHLSHAAQVEIAERIAVLETLDDATVLLASFQGRRP